MRRANPENAQLGMVDVETSPITPGERPRTYMWGLALEDEGYERFPDTQSLMARLQKLKGVRLYNHHDFDVCQAIVDGVIPEQLSMRGSRVVRCELGGVPWVNSYAVFPTKLAALMDAAGFKKRALNVDDHPMGCVCLPCWRQLQERNESDCVEGLAALVSAGKRYKEALGIDPVREDFTTAAGAAMAAAERVAGELPVYLEDRDAYRGGRTEAFHLRDCGEVDEWDVNSSYPASFVEAPEVDCLVHCRVRVAIDAAPRPFFRHSSREDGLLFPAGRFDTYFFESNYESYYRQWGSFEVERVHWKRPVDFAWLRGVAPLVKQAYTFKSKGDAFSYPAKIFVNSLYGRLGLKPEMKVSYRASSIPDASHVTYLKIPDGFMIFRAVPRSVRANYLFAAYVTDNARARLYDALMRSGNPLYCDTDSVFVPRGGWKRKSAKALGDWKLEASGALQVRTVKDYTFAGMEKRKGGAQSTLWTLRYALGGKSVTLMRKRRDKRYSKRRVLGDGSTLPLVF
jgi:hypothetical protein